VRNRLKALYRSWAIACAGERVSSPRHRLQRRGYPSRNYPWAFAGFLCRPGGSRNETVDGTSDAQRPITMRAGSPIVIQSTQNYFY